jgi:WD40 repeat protein
MKKTYNTLIIATCLTLTAIVSACQGAPAETPTMVPSPISSPTMEPVVTAIPSPTPLPPVVPDLPLRAEGPWWLFSTDGGLWAVNPDGSGLTQVAFQPLTQYYDPNAAVSPSGGYIAYITGREPIFDTTLRIKVLPWGTMITEKPLTSDTSEPSPDAMPGDFAFDAVRALIEIRSIAFSPDGEFLAFMGMIEGPSSDLYVYSLDEFQLTRLTDGPSQAIKPVWSPDGKYIVHGGVSSLGTGAGYAMVGMWASRADDSGTVTLYDPSMSGDEIVLGWIDQRTFVVYTWNAVCGPGNLRTYNIESGDSLILWEGAFQAAAFDPSSGTSLIAVNNDDTFCNPSGQIGPVIVKPDGLAFRVVEDRVHAIQWSENAGLFLAISEFGTIAVSTEGDFIDLDKPMGANPLPAVAPGTRELAWTGNGLWIGPLLGSIDNPPKTISSEPTVHASWDPSGEYVLFFAEGGLYVAQRPEFVPVLVTGEISPWNGYSAWVIP